MRETFVSRLLLTVFRAQRDEGKILTAREGSALLRFPAGSPTGLVGGGEDEASRGAGDGRRRRAGGELPCHEPSHMGGEGHKTWDEDAVQSGRGGGKIFYQNKPTPL